MLQQIAEAEKALQTADGKLQEYWFNKAMNLIAEKDKHVDAKNKLLDTRNKLVDAHAAHLALTDPKRARRPSLDSAGVTFVDKSKRNSLGDDTFEWVIRPEEQLCLSFLRDVTYPWLKGHKWSKDKFKPPVIDGAMGAGKTRLAYQVATQFIQEVQDNTQPPVKCTYIQFLPDEAEESRAGSQSLARSLVRAYNDTLVDKFDYTLREVLTKIRNDLNGVRIIILHIDEFQDNVLWCKNILRACKDNVWEDEGGLNPSGMLVLPIVSGTTLDPLRDILRPTNMLLKDVRLRGFQKDMGLERMTAAFIEKVNESCETHLTALPPMLALLVDDLGGIPRFFENLLECLVKWEHRPDLHTGLDDERVAILHKKLIGLVSDRYGYKEWERVLKRVETTEKKKKDAARQAIRRLFELALSGVEVSEDTELLPGQAASELKGFVHVGLCALDTVAGRSRVSIPPILVAALNDQLDVVHPDMVNRFKFGWPIMELMAVESFRLRANALTYEQRCETKAAVAVPLSAVRAGAEIGSGVQDVAILVPVVGIKPPSTLALPLSGGLADTFETGIHTNTATTKLQDTYTLTRANQYGVDAIGLFQGTNAAGPGSASAAGGSNTFQVLLLMQAKARQTLTDKGVPSQTTLQHAEAAQLCKLARSVTDKYKKEAPAKSKKSQLTQKSAEGFAGQLKIGKGVCVIVDLFTNRLGDMEAAPHKEKEKILAEAIVTRDAHLVDVVGPVLSQRRRLYDIV